MNKEKLNVKFSKIINAFCCLIIAIFNLIVYFFTKEDYYAYIFNLFLATTYICNSIEKD